MTRPTLEAPDISEHGGRDQRSDRRLYVQFLAFGRCADTRAAVKVIERTGLEAAVYEDINDPGGLGLTVMSEQPDTFVKVLRPALQQVPFSMLDVKHDFAMFGRTYALGYEPDLDETLIERPRRHILNPDWPWMIWYPLRRSGAFEQLGQDEQRDILKEHGIIGMAFGQAGYAYDVRLACHGLSRDDNDFVIGLTGQDLYPLSAIVQRMRKTRQTSQYLERLGPFFVGKAVWKSTAKA